MAMFQEFYSRVLVGGIKPDTHLVAPLFIKMISRRFELTICSLRGCWPKPLVEETLMTPRRFELLTPPWKGDGLNHLPTGPYINILFPQLFLQNYKCIHSNILHTEFHNQMNPNNIYLPYYSSFKIIIIFLSYIYYIKNFLKNQ